MTSKTFKTRGWFRRGGPGRRRGVLLAVLGAVLVVVLLIVVEVWTAPGQRSPVPAPAARNALFNRTDLIYGSQIGSWDMNGGAVASNPVAFNNAKAADIRVVRFQMFDRPTDLGGTESAATVSYTHLTLPTN